MKAETTFRLSRVDPCLPEAFSGLQPGDILVALDGKPIAGDDSDVRKAVAEGRCISTWARNGLVFNVQIGPVLPGPIEPSTPSGEAIELPDQLPQDLKSYSNWMIFCTDDGRIEILRQDRPIVALFFPIVWLVHVRMWTWAGLLALAMTVALPAGPWAVLAVWMAFSIHLWQSGGARLMADRVASGWTIAGRLTCKSEREAHSVWLALNPGTCFVFGGAAQTVQRSAFG